MSGHNRKARDSLRDFRKSMEKENALFREQSRHAKRGRHYSVCKGEAP